MLRDRRQTRNQPLNWQNSALFLWDMEIRLLLHSWIRSWCFSDSKTLRFIWERFTSRRPTATDSATPVERRGRLPWGTGHGSLWSSPSKSVRFISTLCTGWRNLKHDQKYTVYRKTAGGSTSLFIPKIKWRQGWRGSALQYLHGTGASWGAGGRPWPGAVGFTKPSISLNTHTHEKNKPRQLAWTNSCSVLAK